MMTVREFIRNLNLPVGVSRRYDCPACGGNNTLSVTNDLGDVKWFCFRASCGTKGQLATTKSASDISALLKQRRDSEDNFTLPEYFTSVLSEEAAVEYLRRNHCLEAYINKLADIRYDPKVNRVAFLIKNKGRIVDAVGRSLSLQVKPKWYRYGSSSTLFICGDRSVAVVVEDAASACAVSSIATGVGLLGTNLQEAFVSPLKVYEKVIIALDKDASKKAIELHRILSYYTHTEVALLEDDLKFLTKEQIRYVLKLGEQGNETESNVGNRLFREGLHGRGSEPAGAG